MARTGDRREFLQLAHKFNPEKHNVCGWFYSEKLDGQRALWDGGITRGMYCDEIPFANTTKDHIRLQRPTSTGLWSRYGKAIQAPMWFLDELPGYALDGELYCGRGNFQQTMSTVRKLTPVDAEWEKVSYVVFNLPDYSQVFKDGTINVPQWTAKFKDVIVWLQSQKRLDWKEPKLRRFETVAHLLNAYHPSDGTGIVRAARQIQLPFTTAKALEVVDRAAGDVVAQGGEGLILVNHNAIWEPQRTHNCVKVKPFDDAEVIVKGYISGRETDRGSKLRGLMGAMIVDYNGKRLELSGFTNDERTLEVNGSYTEAFDWCWGNPEMEVPKNFYNSKFPIGSKVTILYRELTDDGLPKEARYYRPKPEE